MRRPRPLRFLQDSKKFSAIFFRWSSRLRFSSFQKKIFQRKIFLEPCREREDSPEKFSSNEIFLVRRTSRLSQSSGKFFLGAGWPTRAQKRSQTLDEKIQLQEWADACCLPLCLFEIIHGYLYTNALLLEAFSLNLNSCPNALFGPLCLVSKIHFLPRRLLCGVSSNEKYMLRGPHLFRVMVGFIFMGWHTTTRFALERCWKRVCQSHRGQWACSHSAIDWSSSGSRCSRRRKKQSFQLCYWYMHFTDFYSINDVSNRSSCTSRYSWETTVIRLNLV